MRFVRKKLETEKNFRTWERESYGFLEVSQAILERNSDLGKMMEHETVGSEGIQ